VFRTSNNIPVPAIHGKLPGTGRRKFPVWLEHFSTHSVWNKQ
jgi:hypothetical protein